MRGEPRPAPTWLLFSALLLALYLGTWAFKVPLRVIRPAANMAYFYYSESEAIDRGFYAFYWPCYKVSGLTHIRDRVFPPLTSDP